MLIIRLLFALALSSIFVAHSWAHLQNVPNAVIYIAFAFLGGVGLGLTIAAVITHFSRRL